MPKKYCLTEDGQFLFGEGYEKKQKSVRLHDESGYLFCDIHRLVLY